MNKPAIAIAIGDPAGIGPEIALDIAGQGTADPSSLIRTIERISGDPPSYYSDDKVFLRKFDTLMTE